jgi:KUP system potassium uptake protein
MASSSSNGELNSNDICEGKGMMWELDRSLDQPMDEEAGRLRTMYSEKVIDYSSANFLYF